MNIKPLKIGNVVLENNIILAPMAGITDKSFRRICIKYGNPGLIYTEMASSRAICYNDEKTKQLIDTSNEKRPIAIQIFGNNPEMMSEAAYKIEDRADIIDVNMGCPAPKVVKNGDGSKLLLDLKLVEKILTRLVKTVKIPVTVKIRTGWETKNIVAVEVAKIAENVGVSAIAVHGRTRAQYYSGCVNLDIIKEVKENVSIPVIGNGDIKSVEDANRMFEYTNVDGIMIGRATIGNPWILQEIIQNQKKEVPNDEKLKAILEHLDLLILEKGEYIAIREMRKHICWYIKNMQNSSIIRQKINTLEKKEEIIETLTKFLMQGTEL